MVPVRNVSGTGTFVWDLAQFDKSCGSDSCSIGQPSQGRVLTLDFLPCGRFVAEQQPLPPTTQMQPISGSTVRPPAPSPVFSPSVMLPHGSFVSHPGSTPLHLHPWPQQQVQQHRLYLQVRSVAVCRAGVGSEGSGEEIGLS